jgi:hypothetical protein
VSIGVQILSVLSLMVIVYTSRNYSKLFIRTYVRVYFSIGLFLLFVVSLFPQILEYVSEYVGFGRAADFIFFTTTLSLVALCGILIAKFRELELQFTKLVREISLNSVNGWIEK